MKSLKDVKVGETATVVKLHGEGATKRRIMDMGITKGVEIHVRKVAPLGDPMELNVSLLQRVSWQSRLMNRWQTIHDIPRCAIPLFSVG